MKRSLNTVETNTHGKSYRIFIFVFVVIFILCCVLLGGIFLLFAPELETNYCLDGGHFELSIPLTNLAHKIRIKPEHSRLLIQSELDKSVPIIKSVQSPEILKISYDNYDTLTINTTCELYTADGQLIFKDDESRIMTRSQIEFSQHRKGIEIVFCRNVIITIYCNNNNSSKKNIIVASIKKENGQLIEISSTETNADTVKIYGKIKMTMSGTASTIYDNSLITCLSSEYIQHVNEQRYLGKYIIIVKKL
ncbi:MAG: hypothetical protein LBE18_12710 [Planctomycetaceae bacterium]|nr:hypothetical protein [Planctomycetaceae bacterium]